MARPGVSYYDVAKAASTLQLKNELPTIDRVRKILGSGSNSTIALHLKQWKTEQMPEITGHNTLTIPSVLLQQFQNLWEELRRSARQELEDQQAVFEHSEYDLKKSIQAHSEKTEKLRKERMQLFSQIDALNKQVTEQQAEIERQREEQSKQNATLEQQASKLQDKNEVITNLRQQLQSLSANLDHFHEAAQKQRNEDSLAHASQISQMEQRIQSLQQQVSTAAERYQQTLISQERIGFKADKLELEAETAKEKLEEKTKLCATLETKLKSETELRHELATKLSKMEHEAEVYRQKNADLQTQVAVTSEKLNLTSQRCSDLKLQMERYQQDREADQTKIKSLMDELKVYKK